jgi:branched-chain amino acid transport system substrate-binding protein
MVCFPTDYRGDAAMKGRNQIPLFCFLALLLVALPLLAATCGDNEEEKTPTAEEKEVTLGFVTGLSGIAASSIGPSFTRFLNSIKYVNEVMGGIDGIKINFVYADDKYDPAMAVVAIRRLRDRYHPMLWLTWTEANYYGAKDIFERDKTPVLTAAARLQDLYVPPGMFFNYNMGSRLDEFTVVIKWILQDYDGPGRPKLGILYPDDATGRAHQIASSYDWAEERGVDIVGRTYACLPLDLRPSLLALADEEVDYMFLNDCFQAELVIAVRDAHATGLWDGIKFVTTVVGDTYDLIDLVGDGADGLYFVTSYAPWTDGLEATRRYAEGAVYPSRTIEPTDGYDPLWDILTALFRQAIADVGGYENLSGEALYNALQKLDDIDTGGGTGKLGWSPDTRIGVHGLKIIQCRKTEEGVQSFSVTDWMEITNIFEGKEW